ncbi:hypothetical protein D1872_293780 [compost metagenome]
MVEVPVPCKVRRAARDLAASHNDVRLVCNPSPSSEALYNRHYEAGSSPVYFPEGPSTLSDQGYGEDSLVVENRSSTSEPPIDWHPIFSRRTARVV